MIPWWVLNIQAVCCLRTYDANKNSVMLTAAIVTCLHLDRFKFQLSSSLLECLDYLTMRRYRHRSSFTIITARIANNLDKWTKFRCVKCPDLTCWNDERCAQPSTQTHEHTDTSQDQSKVISINLCRVCGGAPKRVATHFDTWHDFHAEQLSNYYLIICMQIIIMDFKRKKKKHIIYFYFLCFDRCLGGIDFFSFFFAPFSFERTCDFFAQEARRFHL